ncbi:hypothetical protein [Actinotalea solisilvae]|uniref:hypothetical protein n=1 Tax=Actinotalea solisilvae TaxID=2072922 RepID=UPI0018F18A02|nr:hypothetical protein [Actinotalea solisilvae]
MRETVRDSSLEDGAPGAITWRAPVEPGLRETRTPFLRRRITLTEAVAALAVVLVAMRTEITLNVTLGTVAALALAPVWLRTLGRFRGAVPLLAVSLLCLPIGVWLTALSADERATSDRLLAGSCVLLVNFVLGIGVLLWARTVMPSAVVAVWFGLGLLVAAPMSGRLGDNPWRFGFSVPLTVLLLALAWWHGSRALEVVLALALAGATAASGGRSLFAILVLAAVLAAWQVPPRLIDVGVSRLRTLLFLALTLAALYTLGQSLTLEGYLGQRAQERTALQTAASGSVILGGRPEVGASTALLGHEPLGFGAGARLNATDLLVAKSGMADLGYDPDNGYVERYMFGDGIELHSFWADLWSDWGLVGVLLGGMIAWHLGAYLSGRLAHRRASALMVYLVVQSGWNLLFSPRYGSYTLLVLAVALVLTPVVRQRDEAPDVPAAPRRAPTGAPPPGAAPA